MTGPLPRPVSAAGSAAWLREVLDQALGLAVAKGGEPGWATAVAGAAHALAAGAAGAQRAPGGLAAAAELWRGCEQCCEAAGTGAEGALARRAALRALEGTGLDAPAWLLAAQS